MMNVGQKSSGAVHAWEEAVVIPSYPVPPPDRNPMFLDKRVYQGSSGKVYPAAFTDRVSDERSNKTYKAIFIENEYVQLMILPEIGGRIHSGLDKSNHYDFFYRQNVIKPALVGLLGPWISGGVEFNWPQHHRPTTFLPVEYDIEQQPDGGYTVWLSEHEPMNRMKGMVGICLHPGKSIIEAKVRLYNRTPFPQTFLWWANVGIRVHDQYQAFFPPDVSHVADHAKRAMSSFPIARNSYYGVDYSSGVDLTWYKNIPVPTSYMVTESKYDYFGGYDYGKDAGVVHVANHHIAPGKKLWTWGNAEFGYAWDRELTDSDGPYIELMAGVYTDNQPDFSWLEPYETRAFSQYWYPIQRIGPAKNANRLLAVNLDQRPEEIAVGVCSTECLENLRVLLTAGDSRIFDQSITVRPGSPIVGCVKDPLPCHETDLLLRVLSSDGKEIIRYRPEAKGESRLPKAASEPLPPREITSLEELYLTGLHVEQYRHATRAPESYWEECLRRDPEDARCNNAMGLLYLRRGQFDEAERYFRCAVGRMTQRNPNPRDGEPHYSLGVTLKYQGRLDDAYSAFYKSVWNYAWQAPGYFALATIDCLRGNLESALEHLERSLSTNASNLKARNLKTAILRCQDHREQALVLARASIATDKLDFWTRNELIRLRGDRRSRKTDQDFFRKMRWDTQTCLDLAFDYAEAGFWDDAIDLLSRFLEAGNLTTAAHPMILYALGYFCERQGSQHESGQDYFRRASQASPDYCFPSRIEEMLVLQAVLEGNPSDPRAHYYLGNLLYDKCRRQEAIQHWERACALDPSFSIPWRNLGIAWFNVSHDPQRALEAYQRAFQANASDARLLYELDQLHKRMGTAPQDRLSRLEQHLDLVGRRDDLTVELVTLYNQTGQSQKALEILNNHRFHPWEGGEGLVSGQYVMAHFILGRSLLEENRPAEALEHFQAAGTYPHNLGEGKHLLNPETHLDYFSGKALEELQRFEEARQFWHKAAETHTGQSVMAYYRALSLVRLGKEEQATSLSQELLDWATRQMDVPVKIDYFATSLPNFLLFDDDLQKRNTIDCRFLGALAKIGLGRLSEAASDLLQVLNLDVNHIWAREELRRLETSSG